MSASPELLNNWIEKQLGTLPKYAQRVRRERAGDRQFRACGYNDHKHCCGYVAAAKCTCECHEGISALGED